MTAWSADRDIKKSTEDPLTTRTSQELKHARPQGPRPSRPPVPLLALPPALPLTPPPAARSSSDPTSPHQIHGLSISNNVTPLLAICTENKIEHELVMCNIMEGCVPTSPLCVSLAAELDLMLWASRREAS